MTAEARQFNAAYLAEMATAPANKTLGRVRELWWPGFMRRVADCGITSTLDALDEVMSDSRMELQRMARLYAESQSDDSAKRTQLTNQFLKSNTGKMFERFVGLAVAHALNEADAPYCIRPFRADTLSGCHGLTREDLAVTVSLGGRRLQTTIDADLFAFDPNLVQKDVFLISIKSTLKDRFHNVPFWNLLRQVAVGSNLPHVQAMHPSVLSRVRYVAICTDLANEQPDFASADGPRELLQIDAALLDGAYVTASGARSGVGTGEDHLGPARTHAFNRLSCFYRHLGGR